MTTWMTTEDHATDEPMDESLHDLFRAAGLAAGPNEDPPPPQVEEQVVASLRASGLVCVAVRHRAQTFAALAAAAVALFACGLLVGRVTSPTGAADDAAPTYALFLLGGAEESPNEAELVEEYRAWAGGLAQRGQLDAGEKLAPAGWALGLEDGRVAVRETAPTGDAMSGLFLLTAEGPEEALDLAASCPHLRHGGRLLLRPIDPT